MPLLSTSDHHSLLSISVLLCSHVLLLPLKLCVVVRDARRNHHHHHREPSHLVPPRSLGSHRRNYSCH
ncbi:unnamed protein product [Brassica oleracea]